MRWRIPGGAPSGRGAEHRQARRTLPRGRRRRTPRRSPGRCRQAQTASRQLPTVLHQRLPQLLTHVEFKAVPGWESNMHRSGRHRFRATGVEGRRVLILDDTITSDATSVSVTRTLSMWAPPEWRS